MNLKSLHDLNHQLQAALRKGQLEFILDALLAMIQETNRLMAKRRELFEEQEPASGDSSHARLA